MSENQKVKVSQPKPEAVYVGSYFLETLTTGMYENPFHCIREYIQNGFDAIQDAVRAGTMPPQDGRITILITRTTRSPSLAIKDNGSGISAANAVSTLISLGASRKSPSLHAGFRGIGRLAGIAYCTTLRFTTTMAGEETATIVEFDCGHIRSYFSPGADPVDVRDVVGSSVRTWEIAAPSAEHFTSVEMLNLVDQGLDFIELEHLQPYLRQVSPVEYPDTFEFADNIRTFAEAYGDELRTVHIEVVQKRERLPILKPYRMVYPTSRTNSLSKLHDIELIMSKEHGWFGWIGISKFPGEITDDTAAGIRFRMKNIGVGDSDIVEQLASELTVSGSDRRLQRWAVGEVFITNSQVVPNARRDGFEDNGAWHSIRGDIRERVVRRVIRLVREESKTRGLMKTMTAQAQLLTASAAGGKLTSEVKAGMLREINKHIVTLSDSTKLLGAVPQERNSLIKAFKDLLETVRELPDYVEPQSDEQDNSNDEDESRQDPIEESTEDNGDTEIETNASADDDPPASHGDPVVDHSTSITRDAVIRSILLTELPADQADRLTIAINDALTSSGF